MAFAGAPTPVLPIGAQGLIVVAEEQFTLNTLGDGLVCTVPGGEGIAFEDLVGEGILCRQGVMNCLPD